MRITTQLERNPDGTVTARVKFPSKAVALRALDSLLDVEPAAFTPEPAIPVAHVPPYVFADDEPDLRAGSVP